MGALASSVPSGESSSRIVAMRAGATSHDEVGAASSDGGGDASDDETEGAAGGSGSGCCLEGDDRTAVVALSCTETSGAEPPRPGGARGHLVFHRLPTDGAPHWAGV